MNELAMVFDQMGIDTREVVDAMNTKWNALGFYPGLVGGHCIGVDPYYFLYKADELGYQSQIVSSGRKINDSMGKFVVEAIIKKLAITNKIISKANVIILGLTFKENCPDIRNSKVMDIIEGLRDYGIDPVVIDPEANEEEAQREYGIELADIQDVENADCLVFAVAHEMFKRKDIDQFDSLFGNFDNEEKIVIDIKSMLDKSVIEARGYNYWRL
jgi:UDP-N-acetyl-D-galactosamine dehydrogenase